MSVFIISFGLLGVLAVIPVGRFNLAEMHKSDRAAACGRAGLREAQVRGILNPFSWRNANLTPVVQQEFKYAPNTPPVPTGRYGLPYRESYAIDPLFLARNFGQPGTQRFPYDPDPGVAGDEPPLSMRRVTLNAVPYPAAAAHQAVYERIFTWSDILNVPVPKSRDERPRQFVAALDTSGNTPALLSCAWPTAPADGVPSGQLLPVARQTLADFTWMITVTPRSDIPDFSVDVNNDNTPDDIYGDGFFDFHYFGRKKLYDVSVVVFHKRNFEYPPPVGESMPERVVMAPRSGFLSQGLGGGDVVLVARPAPVGTTADLEVTKGDWLLLCGVRRMRLARQIPPPQPAWLVRYVFKWYRVVAVGELDLSDPARPSRYVTLAGPDWDLDWCTDLDGDGSPEAQAVLFDGIMGVYTVTRELDSGSVWNY